MAGIQDVVNYVLVTSSDDGREYFLLEQTTGTFILIKPLTQARQEYQVTVLENRSLSHSIISYPNIAHYTIAHSTIALLIIAHLTSAQSNIITKLFC